MAFKIRRGTAAERAAMSAGDPAQSEIVHETDTNKLFIGDGSTAGGVYTGGAGDLVATNNLSDVDDQQTALNNVTNVSGATGGHVLIKDVATGDAVLTGQVGPVEWFEGEQGYFDDVYAYSALYNWSIKINDLEIESTGRLADDTIDEANLILPAGPTNDYALLAASGESGGMKWGDIAANTAVDANTTHRTSVGSDHSLCVSNAVHATGDGDDHADVAANTTHAGLTNNPHEVKQTEKKIFYIEDPAVSDDYPLLSVPFNVTITRVSCITDAGTVDFNLMERPETVPGSGGTKVWTLDQEADTLVDAITTFDNDTINIQDWIALTISAVDTATKLWVGVTWTED